MDGLLNNNYPIDLKIGDKIFVNTLFNWKSPMTWLSFAIRKVANLEYNHVKVVGLDDDGLCFVEAVAEGVVKSPIEYHNDKERILIRRNKIKVDTQKCVNDLNEIIGKPYDKKSLLLVELLWALRMWVGAFTEKEAKEKFICYEVYWWMDRSYFGKLWWMMPPNRSIEQDFTYEVYKD